MKNHPASNYVADVPHQSSHRPRRACRRRLALFVALLTLAAAGTFSGCASQGLAGLSGSSVSNALTGTQGTSNSGLSSAPSPFNTPGLAHDVSLTWNPSASSGVLGYNVYRGTGSGGPYTKLNTSLIAASSYTDRAVQAGQTYFYVVTATSSGDVESVYSNETSAAVP